MALESTKRLPEKGRRGGEGALDPVEQMAEAATEGPLISVDIPCSLSTRCRPPCVGCAEGYARDATEIQNIQIADGDVCRSLSVPIYMVFPRLFTCPTLETTNFKVGKRASPLRLWTCRLLP